MKCPVCKNDMIILELEQVEIDYCSVCKGIWLDGGELELIYHDTSSNDVDGLFQKFQESTEPNIKCPICSKRMGKVEFNKTGIILDKCKDHHGYWFDKGELKSLLESRIDNNSRIVELLKNIFGQ